MSMKKSNLIFVLKISVLGILLYFGSVEERFTSSKHQEYMPHDSLNTVLYPQETYWEDGSISSPSIILVKK